MIIKHPSPHWPAIDCVRFAVGNLRWFAENCWSFEIEEKKRCIQFALRWLAHGFQSARRVMDRHAMSVIARMRNWLRAELRKIAE